jgi:hypothetical protein
MYTTQSVTLDRTVFSRCTIELDGEGDVKKKKKKKKPNVDDGLALLRCVDDQFLASGGSQDKSPIFRVKYSTDLRAAPQDLGKLEYCQNHQPATISTV